MRQARAICFDLDDTLLETGSLGRAIERVCGVLADETPGLDAARLLKANGEAWDAYWPEVEQSWTLGRLDTASLGLEAWTRTLRACDCDDPGLATRARDLAWEHQWEDMRVFDDVTQVLDSLRRRYPLALITNGASDLQREKLRRLGIEPYFSAVLISGEAGCCKPDAAVFHLAAENLGVRPEDAWHIGDSPANDVVGAAEAGLTAVWLNRRGAGWPGLEPKPDYEVRSLDDLMSLLAETG